MAYDEELADRIRALMSDRSPVEKRAFGGLCFMVGGKMAIAASGQGGALVRVDPDVSDELCEQPGVERMVMRGREMNGWLRVGSAELESDHELRAWIDRGAAAAAAAT